MTTSWARSRAPSLAMARLTCVFTVSGLTSRRSAISSLEWPCGDLDQHLPLPHGERVEPLGALGVEVGSGRAVLGEEAGDQALGGLRGQQRLSPAAMRTALSISSGSEPLPRKPEAPARSDCTT